MINKFKSLTGSEKKIVFFILLLAFFIKVFLAFYLNPELRSDSLDYINIAKSIVTAGEYSLDGKPTAYVVCGYPLFLASIFKTSGFSILAVKLIQSFLEIFTGLFFFLTCIHFFESKYSFLGLVLFTFLPSNILFSQTILTESLFGFLFSIIFYHCIKEKVGKNAFFIGILWGAAVLVRSSFAISLFLMILFLFLYRRSLFEGYKTKRLKRALQCSMFFLIGFIIVIAPWLIRNKITMNTFTLATQGGFTFWSGSNPDATGTWYYKIEESNPLFKVEDEAIRDKEFYKLGMEYAIKNPHKFLILGVKKLGYLFSSERLILLYFTESEKGKTSTEIYKTVNPMLLALVNIPYFFVMLCGIWGLLALKKKTFFLWGFILMWCFTFFMFVALARYHYVLIPFFIIGTVKLIQERKNIFKQLTKWKIIIAAAFNVFLIFVWVSEFYLMLTK
jgi:hypothetical protein